MQHWSAHDRHKEEERRRTQELEAPMSIDSLRWLTSEGFAQDARYREYSTHLPTYTQVQQGYQEIHQPLLMVHTSEDVDEMSSRK